MPSPLQYLTTLGIPAANALQQGLATSAATGNLTQGATNASNIIQGNAQKLQDIINANTATSQGYLAPYVGAGTQNAAMLNAGLLPGGGLADPYGKTFSFTGQDLASAPGYQFALQQGQNAINAARAAMGTRFSGGAVKAADQYATDYAETKFNDAFNQALQSYGTNANQFEQDQANRYNRLQAATQTGLSAAGTAAGITGQNTAAQVNVGQFTAQDLAELQLALAQAKATGNTTQAANISNLLAQVPQALKTLGIGQTTALPSSTVFPPAGSINQNPQAAPGTNVGTLTDPYSGSPQGTPGTSSILQQPAPNIPAGSGGYIPISGELNPAIGDTSSLGGQVQNLVGSLGTVAGPVGTALGGIGTGGGGTLAGIVAGNVPEIPLSGIGAATAGVGQAGLEALPAVGAEAAPAAAPATGFLSQLAPIAHFFTNPYTIAIGAALAGALIWKNSQVHPTANTFVQKFQNPFGQKLSSVVNAFDQALASGNFSKADAQAAYQQTAQLIQDFQKDTADFAKKGSKEAIVARQAAQTMASWAGPNWENVLGKMQTEISQLPG